MPHVRRRNHNGQTFHSYDSENSLTMEDPDFIDLNDWVFENYPKEHEASRYLDPTAQYLFHLRLWHLAGKPKLKSAINP